MATTLYWILCAAFYVAVIAALIRRRRDILADPKKYAEIPGWDRYRNSMWYERKYQRYGPHYHASLLVGIPGLLLFCGGYHILGRWIQRQFLIPRGALLLSGSNLIIGGIASIFFWIIFEEYLCFRSKWPICIAARLYGFGGNNPVAWRKMITNMIVLGALCLPVMLYAVSGWSCATEDGLIFRTLIPAGERVYRYEEIVDSQADWSSNTGKTEFSFSYELTMADGTVIDLCDDLSKGDVSRLHQLLRENGIPFTPCSLDPEIWSRMQTVCSSSQLKFIRSVFVLPEENLER